MIKYQSAEYGFYYKLINWLTRLSDDARDMAEAHQKPFQLQ